MGGLAGDSVGVFEEFGDGLFSEWGGTKIGAFEGLDVEEDVLVPGFIFVFDSVDFVEGRETGVFLVTEEGSHEFQGGGKWVGKKSEF